MVFYAYVNYINEYIVLPILTATSNNWGGHVTRRKSVYTQICIFEINRFQWLWTFVNFQHCLLFNPPSPPPQKKRHYESLFLCSIHRTLLIALLIEKWAYTQLFGWYPQLQYSKILSLKIFQFCFSHEFLCIKKKKHHEQHIFYIPLKTSTLSKINT